MAVERPCDYYSSASPERVLPAWAPYGCGAAALLILILIFAGGAFLAHGGFTEVMDLVFGMTMGEMRGMYTADVTAAQKQSLEREIETMRRLLREEKISVQSLQPMLKTIQKGTGDQKLTAGEVERIVAAARKLNAAAQPRNRETAQP